MSFCCLIVKANSVLYVKCSKCVHCRCAAVKLMTPKCSRNFACMKCEGIADKVMECNEVAVEWRFALSMNVDYWCLSV